MKNRKAWGLVAVLAVVVLGSLVPMVKHNHRLPEEYRWVLPLRRDNWGFGPDPDTVMRIILRERLVRILKRQPRVSLLDRTMPERYKVGFLSVRVK